MSEERKLVLEMLKQGKISVEEAESLLEDSPSTDLAVAEPAKPSKNKKFLKVLIREDGKNKVNINFPIGLAEAGLKLIPKDQLKIKGQEINLNQILDMIHEGLAGDLINIDTVDDGKHVQVHIYMA